MRIIFNQPQELIEKRLKNIDIVCTDLDECLFPFFTQALIAGEILIDSILKTHYRRYVPRLLRGGLFVFLMMIISLGNLKRMNNELLMKCFEKTMRGIPMELIRQHSQYIHTFFYSDSLSFLNYFARRGIPVIILSLSIQPILDVLKEKIGFINEAIGNNVKTDEKQNFDSYLSPIMKNDEDKLQKYKEIIGRYKAECPLIIGHSKDELLLVDDARLKGGVSIGINPKKRMRTKFDIILQCMRWEPLVLCMENVYAQKY